MQVTVQRLSPVLVELHVEVPVETVKAEVDKAFASLAKTSRIKGFRPGKAPRNVLAHLFGPKVKNDVANAIVNNTLPRALHDHSVMPVSEPAVEAGAVDAKSTFSYKARFEVQPDIGEVTFEGFELVRPSIEMTPQLVEEQLERLRAARATLRAPEPPRPAQSGDVVTVDFTLSIEGVEVPDGGGQGVPLELGARQVLPELEAALMGKSVGDHVTASSVFPETHQKVEARGKTGVFSIQVVDIKERVLPTLDDEFAKDVGEFETLDALRADIEAQLKKALTERAESALAEQIVAKLNEANPLDVPASLVHQQRQIMEQEVAAQARRFNTRMTREQAEALQQRLHADAERKVRAGLLMAAIARKHEFTVTEDDIENAFKELAEESGKNVAKVKAEYREANKRQLLMGMILEDKILDFIETKSVIVDAPAAGEGSPDAAEPPAAEGMPPVAEAPPGEAPMPAGEPAAAG